MTELLGDEIFDRMIATPFEPFRIRLRDGGVADVTNGEYVGWNVSYISVYDRPLPGAPREWRRYPLTDIAAVELLAPATAGR